MYKTFYSLSREPFSKDTSPSEAYRGSSYEEALHALD
ncbi:MAG: AAA family ATPase, partial [Bacillaceae bacterium]